MVTSGEVVLRRSWPQRFVILVAVAVVVGAALAAWFVSTLYDGLAEVGRVEIAGDVLRTETPPGEPVNILVVGTDSAEGIDPDDPIHFDRETYPNGRYNADSISLLRLDPRTQQASVVSIPRDLWVEIAGAAPGKINSTLRTEGPERLIETVSDTLGVDINHYVLLDFLAFRELVDEIDGVPVWFPNPTRSVATGLNVPTPGCYVLDGVEALEFVRVRSDYQELIDGDWVTTGSSDFDRIERQQDFLILALDRAIQRGARNPRTLAALLEAGATSVEFDSRLTIAELADLGEAFTEFDPEALARYALEVETLWYPGGEYQGEQLIDGDANDAVIEVFRGAASGLRPADVEFDLVGDVTVVAEDGAALADLGFDVEDEFELLESIERSVVIHPPGQRDEAVSIARYLSPAPAVVEDPDASSITVVLGRDHEVVTIFGPRSLDDTLADIADDDVDLPDLVLGERVPARPPAADVATGTAGATPASTRAETTAPTTASSTTVSSTTVPPAVPDDRGVFGQPPDGETCA